MITEQEPVHRTGSRLLLLPFLLIAISAILALIELIYVLGSYLHLYQPSNSFVESSLVGAIYTLVLPLFVMGVALLLMFLTTSKKGMAIWSRLTFLLGAVLFIVGGLFAILYWGELSSSWNMMDVNHDLLSNLSIIGGIANILGTVLCAIATVLLVRCYLKGEVFMNPGFKQQRLQSDRGAEGNN